MNVRTTVDIPQPLHDRLREESIRSGKSMRSLILQAVEQAYTPPKKGKFVTEPMIRSRGKVGPLMPVDKNPWDLVF
jgi:hypothetical protein